MTSAVDTEAMEIVATNPALALAVARLVQKNGGLHKAVGLTSRQRDLLDFIQAYTADHGITPTYREMAKGIGVNSVSRVSRLVVDLEARGHITRKTKSHRSIKIL